ncbi:MAG TPA: hypothetical protein VFL86_29820 [Burkholderiaceae bacterium]|nr:hypothetical protein [Burkholderiaceae bacterium]
MLQFKLEPAEENFPGASSKLDAKLHKVAHFRGRSESDEAVFMREDGEPCMAFIESLKLDVANDEFELTLPIPKKPVQAKPTFMIRAGHPG